MGTLQVVATGLALLVSFAQLSGCDLHPTTKDFHHGPASAPAPAPSSGHPAGHQRPLGAHRPPAGSVVELDYVPDPITFLTEYIIPGKSVIFKNAAKKLLPAFHRWTDKYMVDNFGDLEVEYEYGKKENRSEPNDSKPLKHFLNIYNMSDVYLVADISKNMMKDFPILPCLRCGGYTKRLQQIVMWMSSGGTKSVLHNDGFDNINCLLDGSKRMLLWDKNYEIISSKECGWNFKEGLSNVDVDSVDMDKYGCLKDLDYYVGDIYAGDCMYLPYRWFHQVNSFGTRSLAVNIWWAHFTKPDVLDPCPSSFEHYDPPAVTMDSFPFHASTYSTNYDRIKGKLELHRNRIPRDVFHQYLATDSPVVKEQLDALFTELDTNADHHVGVKELLALDPPHTDYQWDTLARLNALPLLPERDEDGLLENTKAITQQKEDL